LHDRNEERIDVRFYKLIGGELTQKSDDRKAIKSSSHRHRKNNIRFFDPLPVIAKNK
jgi:hypothetical protein